MEFPVSERTLQLWVVQLSVEIERGFTRRNWVSFTSSSFTRLSGECVPREPQEDLCHVNKQESRGLEKHFLNLTWKKGFPRVLLGFGAFLVMCGSSKTILVLW